MGKNKLNFIVCSKVSSIFLCLNFLVILSCGFSSPKKHAVKESL